MAFIRGVQAGRERGVPAAFQSEYRVRWRRES